MCRDEHFHAAKNEIIALAPQQITALYALTMDSMPVMRTFI